MTVSIKALIVDDEPLACRRIARMLSNDPEIQVAAVCHNGKDAVAEIRRHSPDLLFLDVQMPAMDGFSLLKSLPPDLLPHVIFVTAYDQYALQAFDVHALDYLLKPFDRERFGEAISRAKSQIQQERKSNINHEILSLLENIDKKKSHLSRLLVKQNGRVSFVRTEEIDWIEAEGKYVSLHVGKEAYLVREAIGNIESQLDPKKFLRIHRSTIVNVDRIRELQPWFHGEYRVLLGDGTQLMLSRSYRQKLHELLGKPL